ncbi:short-chain dehydrogenase [Sphaerisporangium rufum]|uniref:Short-chain dehydrogenase n=1 Tax=Sphaerisporangium rufum TaxID=1381558 RepID=A0A919V077_9ACTN|nr:SDR family oxidoreductase [Sphaerisporangium rufum]GII78494.1 short-chain dehydrogenase [Sphaerisporangium rufum]
MTEQERVAVVTGTSRGLGEAIARRLLGDGYRVVGISRGGTTGITTPGFTDLRADLTDTDRCEELVDQVLAATGRIDVLVNNAAAMIYAPCWELEPALLDVLLRTNLTAPFLLSRDVLRHWVRSETTGTIVNICSIESEVAWDSPPQAGYAATKGGMAGLTRALAYDHGRHGIRVNGVAPGIIRTAMAPPEAERDLGTRVPLQGRLAEPEEIAAAVAFLCTEDASYITGEILYADGGYRLP